MNTVSSQRVSVGANLRESARRGATVVIATSIAEKKAAALRRITELSEVEELPTRRRSYRVPKLAAAIATWSTAAILVADVQLYDWTTWLV